MTNSSRYARISTIPIFQLSIHFVPRHITPRCHSQREPILFHVIRPWQIVTASSVHSSLPLRLLIFLRVMSFAHPPQNTVVTILGESLPACRVVFISGTFNLRLDGHSGFNPAQPEKLPRVGSIGHIVVTINQVTVGRRQGLPLDTLISQSNRYDNRPAPQRRRQWSSLER